MVLLGAELCACLFSTNILNRSALVNFFFPFKFVDDETPNGAGDLLAELKGGGA